MQETEVLEEAEVLPAPVIEAWSVPAVRTPIPLDPKFVREEDAFQQLLPELLKSHRGKYVAVHEEQVVDAGDDQIELALRAYKRYGYIPIYVTLVTDQPRIERITSPRFVREPPAP